MTFEELAQRRANIHGLISTTVHCNVASDFYDDGLGRPHLESIIFTIKIHPNMAEKPFAKIQDFSYMSHEGEVLFGAGTIFRIIDVGELSEGIWSVELELSSDVQEQWHDVMLYLRTEMAGRPTLVTLGNFLAEMGNLDKSERYYQSLMNELENEEDTGAILMGIAAVHFRKHDFNRALDYCTRGLEQLATLTYIHPDLATAYNLMSMIQLEMNQLDDAMQYFEHSLNVHEKTLLNDDPLIAADLHNMATVEVKAYRFDAALTKFQRCLQIKLAVLPVDHPLIGLTYVNMGLLYAKQKKWSDAYYFYDKAIDLQCKTLPPTHIDLAISYANKARILIDEQQFGVALQLYKQALDIQLKKIPLSSHHLANIYGHLGLIYIHSADYTQAICSLKKSLQYEPDCHASWDQLCQLRNNMGTAYYKNGNIPLALREYEIALDLILSSDYSSNRFSSLNNIATGHLSMGNYANARHFYQQLLDAFIIQNEFAKAIENYELVLQYDSLNENLVIATHNSIGTVHYLSGDIQSALCSYHQALNIYVKTQSNDNSELTTIYSNMANAYCESGDLIEALNYYTKQLKLEIDLDVKHQIVKVIENIRHNL